MISNFLKIAVRSLLKQKVFAGFNILGIAMGIACSIVVYLLIQHQLSQNAYHIPVTAGSFVGKLFLMLLLAMATIGSQVYKIATANPVKALQTE